MFGGNPRVTPRGYPLTIWAYDILTGRLKWLRVIGQSLSSLVGYADSLIVASNGMLRLLDVNTGAETSTHTLMSFAETAMPIVNWQLFHMGGGGKWASASSVAHFVEILTPAGL